MRESGTDGPGVAEIMKAAGLTHGGFYKHFGSRDDLVAEAVEAAIAEGEVGYREATAGAADPLAAFVDWYLSDSHRDNPGSGCAVVALGADAARADDRVRAAYGGQVEHYIAHIEELLGGDEEARRRADRCGQLDGRRPARSPAPWTTRSSPRRSSARLARASQSFND